MFCKYCGQDIPDNSEFCPECGKKLKQESVPPKEERRPAGTVLALMLLAICGDALMDWGRVLLFGDRLHIGMLITIVMLAVGLVLLGRAIGQEKIYASDYRLSDLLVFLCVWIVVPGLLLRWGELQLVYLAFGTRAYSAYWITKMPSCQ